MTTPAPSGSVEENTITEKSAKPPPSIQNTTPPQKNAEELDNMIKELEDVEKKN